MSRSIVKQPLIRTYNRTCRLFRCGADFYKVKKTWKQHTTKTEALNLSNRNEMLPEEDQASATINMQ